jgi:hypothetical protein
MNCYPLKRVGGDLPNDLLKLKRTTKGEFMDNATLTSTTAGSMGYWFGGFIIPMAVAYILLRFAGSVKRKASTAIILRTLAVLAAVFLSYAGYVGGEQINPGSFLAIVVTIVWALKQQFAGKTA